MSRRGPCVSSHHCRRRPRMHPRLCRSHTLARGAFLFTPSLPDSMALSCCTLSTASAVPSLRAAVGGTMATTEATTAPHVLNSESARCCLPVPVERCRRQASATDRHASMGRAVARAQRRRTRARRLRRNIPPTHTDCDKPSTTARHAMRPRPERGRIAALAV